MTHHKRSLTLALALACSASAHASEDNAGQVFKPSSDCSTHKDYDAAWASHGNDFGFGNSADAKASISGIYQLRTHGSKLYAAFGGAFGKGVTPGALLVLDADSMALERVIALPFQSHALALDADAGKAVVTHTHANAFSLVDLPSGQVHCVKPDTTIDGRAYNGRYAAFGEDGGFFINTIGWGSPTRSAVFKYNSDGEHAQGFVVSQTEQNAAIPLLYHGGRVLTGSRGVKAVDAATGTVSRLTTDSGETNIYNYVAGPRGQLLASNYFGSRNLLLIDPSNNAESGIFTGLGTVEVAYVAEAGQAISSNFDSKTVTVAALPETGLVPGAFVNIVFDGSPATLGVRRGSKGTDIFVAAKYWGDENRTKAGLLHRIRIAANVRGVTGITAPGACTVTVFDMADRSVSAPHPCEIQDARSSYRANSELLEKTVADLVDARKAASQKLETARSALQQARASKQGEDALRTFAGEVAAVETQIASMDETLAKAQVGRDVLQRLAGRK